MNDETRAELYDAIERRVADVFADTDGMTTASAVASNVMRVVRPIIDRLLADIAARALSDEMVEAVWTEAMDAASVAQDIIAHLWRMADRPEVVEVVDKALMEWSTHPDRLIDGYDHEMRTSVAITALLTALIGPRPAEQESHDE